jgi:hypothetical protein
MAAGDPRQEPIGYRDRPDQSSPLRRPLEGLRPLLAFLFRNLSCCVRFLFAIGCDSLDSGGMNPYPAAEDAAVTAASRSGRTMYVPLRASFFRPISLCFSASSRSFEKEL